MCGQEDLANFWDVCCCCLSVCVCIAAVGVGAGRQKGWDGLDGGGEITNFGGERLNFWGNVLRKQVRASSQLLPALCPKLLLLLKTTRWAARLKLIAVSGRKSKSFENLVQRKVSHIRLDWSSQLSLLHFTIPSTRCTSSTLHCTTNSKLLDFPLFLGVCSPTWLSSQVGTLSGHT